MIKPKLIIVHHERYFATNRNVVKAMKLALLGQRLWATTANIGFIYMFYVQFELIRSLLLKFRP